MKDDTQAHLHDVIQSAYSIRKFVNDKSFEMYSSDELLRSAVERKFEIMGEALNRIRREETDILDNIRYHRDIISFRNILIHGYDTIDDRIVWGIIEEDLDSLIEDVEKLIS